MVFLGIKLVSMMVVLNLLSDWVKVSMLLVMSLWEVSGSVMVKKVFYGFVFKVCVICLKCGLIFLKVMWVVCIKRGSDIIVVVRMIVF